MNHSIIADNFTLTYGEKTCLIEIPSNFTAVESNYLKQLFNQYAHSFEAVANKLTHDTFKKVILDLGQTTFINSDGLFGLCQILLLAKNAKIDLTFLSISSQVKIILSLAGLEHIFPIEASATTNFVE